MKLQLIDVLILLAYLATMIFIGFWLRKKAAANKDSYLMGGKTLPWYMLGLSDASDMFDISGTMWMVACALFTALKASGYPGCGPCLTRCL
jgi:SSS family solute:Na+ symporter